jgi:hypothetical protein
VHHVTHDRVTGHRSRAPQLTPSVTCCRLLRSWSFQAKLGIVTNTLLRAAPQLGHLLLVILACLLLFALVACVGLGERVMPLSSAAGAVEETFSVLLGLGTVGLADVFPAGVSLSAAEALLGLLIYYLRVVLFVMILSQYFMATLGAEFSRLKWLGRVLHARSIGADLAADIAPELRLRMQHMMGLKGCLVRCRTRTAVVPANPAQFERLSAAAGATCGSLGSSKAALQLIRACMPGLDSCSDSHNSSSSKLTVEVMGRQLDMSALQQLLLQLADGSKVNHLQLHTTAGGKAASLAAGCDMEAAGDGVGDAGAAAAAAAAAMAAALLGSLRGTAIQECAGCPQVDAVTHYNSEVAMRKEVLASLAETVASMEAWTADVGRWVVLKAVAACCAVLVQLSNPSSWRMPGCAVQTQSNLRLESGR